MFTGPCPVRIWDRSSASPQLDAGLDHRGGDTTDRLPPARAESVLELIGQIGWEPQRAERAHSVPITIASLPTTAPTFDAQPPSGNHAHRSVPPRAPA